jgi:hypothetical protein
MMQRLQGKGHKNVVLFSWNMKSHIFCNGYKDILHNIMWGRPLLTMNVMKKMDPHRIQRLAANVVLYPKDETMKKT